MEVFAALTIGLIGAFVGAGLSHASSTAFEKQRTQRRRAGILRALVGELDVNSFAAVGIIHSQGHVGTIATETWRNANLELAQFIENRLYRRLLALYAQVPVLESVSLHARQEGQSVVESLRHILDRWIEDNDSLIQELVQCPEARGIREEYSGKMSGSAMRSLLDNHGTSFIDRKS